MSARSQPGLAQSASSIRRTSLHNPNFADYVRLCGGHGFRVIHPDEMAGAIQAGLTCGGPAIVEILTDPNQT